ncbi:MAG: peptidoglycan-binding protein, partial [Alphaproteobacteria bacterium]|nr:peptidoglycan-binding protein [Alphaproteobacteria bacterium]
AIAAPGLKLEEIFKRTIDGVAAASANKQTPWVSSSFRGDFYFHPAAVAPPPPPPVAAVPSLPAIDEQTAWTTIASSTNPVMFELFLKRFPNGAYADFARARLEELKTAAVMEEKRRVAAAEEAKARAAAEEARRIAAAEEAKRKADADAEARRVAAAEEAKRKAADEEARRTAAAEEAKRRAAAEEEKKSVETVEAALKLADVDRRRIQAALTAKGFDTMGTDGAFGPRTRQMISNWQRSRSEPPTGFLTATQAALLSKDGETALSRLEDERRKAEDEKRKADAERQKAAPAPQQAAAAPPSAPAPAPTPAPVAAAPAASGFDGVYHGRVCREDQRWCRQLTVIVSGGVISARSFSGGNCGIPIEMRGPVSPSGSFSGSYQEASGADTNCEKMPATFSGQISGNQISGKAGVALARIVWSAKKQ